MPFCLRGLCGRQKRLGLRRRLVPEFPLEHDQRRRENAFSENIVFCNQGELIRVKLRGDRRNALSGFTVRIVIPFFGSRLLSQ